MCLAHGGICGSTQVKQWMAESSTSGLWGSLPCSDWRWSFSLSLWIIITLEHPQVIAQSIGRQSSPLLYFMGGNSMLSKWTRFLLTLWETWLARMGGWCMRVWSEQNCARWVFILFLVHTVCCVHGYWILTGRSMFFLSFGIDILQCGKF